MLRIRLIIGLVALSVLATACGGGSKTAEGTRAPKESNVERLAAQTDDAGNLTKDAALQLFALTYGAMPGVATPNGGLGAPADGSLATSGVFAHWSELTEPQREAVTRALNLPKGFAPVAGRAGKTRTSAPPPAKYTKELAQVRGKLEGHLGVLGVPIYLETPSAAPEPDVLGDALVRDGDLGNGCYARVYQDTNKGSGSVVSTLAHELFHCYQQVWKGRPPAWIEEGTAEWVGATITAELGYPFDPADQNWIERYSATPERSLLARSYDAFGWFAYVAESAPLWSNLRAVVGAPYNRAAYDAAIAGASGALVEQWSPAQLDDPVYGPTWAITGPGIPPAKTKTTFLYKPLGNGGTLALNATNFAAALRSVSLQADVTVITMSAALQGLERRGGSDDPLAGRSGTFCTKTGGGCACPPGTMRAGMTFPDIPRGDRIYAFSGGPNPAAMGIFGYSLSDACNLQSCAVGTWVNRTPPSITGFVLTGGGTGLKTIIDPDGRVTLDYGSGVTFEGERGSIPFTLTATGSGTAIADLPPGETLSSPVPFHDVNLSGITGSGSVSVGGYTVAITPDIISELLGAANGTSGAWSLAECQKDRLTITTTNATWTFERVK